MTSIEVDKSWLKSPATRAGSYDLIALLNRTSGGTSSSRFARPGDFQLDVSKTSQAFAYTLNAPPGFLPDNLTRIAVPVGAESWDFNANGQNYRYENPYGDDEQFFGENLKEYELYSDGSKKLREDYDYDRASFENGIIPLPSGEYVSESLTFDASLSYVAMGEWSWGPVNLNADGTATPTGDKSSIYFVFGDRTPAAGIPAAGTATYDAHTLSNLPFTLTADFGQRSISTEISVASKFDVSGSAGFTNAGNFEIPLTGTAGTLSTTGTVDGAFFGPNAEQIGGVVSVGDQGSLLEDAFVGQQH